MSQSEVLFEKILNGDAKSAAAVALARRLMTNGVGV